MRALLAAECLEPIVVLIPDYDAAKIRDLREKNKLRQTLCFLVCAFATCLAACGGGGGNGDDTSNGGRTYYSNIEGIVTGLATGSSLTLSLNSGSQSLVVTANGRFKFPGLLTFDSSYSVAVASQPTNQSCRVFNGSGPRTGYSNSDGSNIAIYGTNVEVICYSKSALYDFESNSIGDLGISTWGVSSSSSSGLPANSDHAGNYVLKPNSASFVSAGSINVNGQTVPCTKTNFEVSRSVNRVRFDYAVSVSRWTLRFYAGSTLQLENYGTQTGYRSSGSSLREFDGNNGVVNWMHYDSGPLNLGLSIYHFEWVFLRCGPANSTDVMVIDNLIFE